MQNSTFDLNKWKTLTFKELTKIPIEEKKILAHHIIKEGGLNDSDAKVLGWGAFEKLNITSYDQALAEAKKFVEKMSLEEKVGQMTPNTTAIHYAPACLKYNDFPYIAGENQRLNIPGIRFSDGPSGIVMGTQSTCFPVSMGRAATWNVDLERRVGEAIGTEGRALGANFFGGVCVNILRHPSWGRSQETYGEDPHLLGKMGVALIEGVQNHMMACVKHYALNSMENMRYKVNVEVDERTLRELYLPHFKECIDANVAAVMAAYNKVRGDHCCENSYLLTDILKKEWNFKGVVVSDFINGIYNGAKAANAGLDIEMPIEGHYGKNLVDLVHKKEVPLSVIDQAATRIIATKIWFAHLLKEKNYPLTLLSNSEHTALAKEVAIESAVLLKNEKALLPLDITTLKKVVVMGPLADRINIGEMKGSARVYPPYAITPLAALQEMCKKEEIELSYIQDKEHSQALREADVVILVVGVTSDDEGEYIPHWNSGAGGDRVDLNLKREDIELIEYAATLNEKTVVVMQGGGALMTEGWDSLVSSILMTWYPGMEGGNALVDLLLGKHSPSGKLPLTIPKRMDQLPPFDKDAKEVVYDYFHGYFEIDRANEVVSYPFGFGLSYTTFEYSDPRIHTFSDKVEVSVTLKNRGSHKGSEVVQLYIGCNYSSVVRHVKALKAFTKVALSPNQKERITLTVPYSSLAIWDEKNQSWLIEKGDYSAYVGSSSNKEDLLELSFRIE